MARVIFWIAVAISFNRALESCAWVGRWSSKASDKARCQSEEPTASAGPAAATPRRRNHLSFAAGHSSASPSSPILVHDSVIDYAYCLHLVALTVEPFGRALLGRTPTINERICLRAATLSSNN